MEVLQGERTGQAGGPAGREERPPDPHRYRDLGREPQILGLLKRALGYGAYERNRSAVVPLPLSREWAYGCDESTEVYAVFGCFVLSSGTLYGNPIPEGRYLCPSCASDSRRS